AALVNHSQIHSSPSAERFYRLQCQRIQKAKRKRSTELSRDEKVELRAFRKHLGWDYYQIAQATGKTVRQVQNACTGPLTPQKHKKRRELIRTPNKQRLKSFLDEDERHRRISWEDLR